MIVVKLAGGMGNQMFQYAAGRHLAAKYDTELKLDLSFLQDKTPKINFTHREYDLGLFNIEQRFATSEEVVKFGRYRRLNRVIYVLRQKLDQKLPVYVRENPYRFDQKFFNIPDNAYIEGYWQSEKYFKAIESDIRREFSFRNGLDANGREMAARISSVNAVCINVRRGDYVTNPAANLHHGVCSVDYFTRAVAEIVARVPDPHFFIFSDDLEWCRENLYLDRPCTIVGDAYAGEKYGQKLNLMTMCRHFIIPNSSFGWWGAWLSTNPGKVVVAPARWCQNPRVDSKDTTPPEWLRI